jgi:hypothetical protein
MGMQIVSVAEKPAGVMFHEGIDPMTLRGWRPWAREKRKSVEAARLKRSEQQAKEETLRAA